MPLPASNSPWPPKEWAPTYAKLDEWASWYSGDPNRLINTYAGTPRVGRTWWRFWSRAREVAADGSQRAQLHVPIASDLAAVSGSLLFGEHPRIRVKAAHEDEEPDEVPVPGEPRRRTKKPETPEQKSEARLLEMFEEGDVFTRLLEAAESAAAMGGVFIYPAWDKEVR